MTKPGNSKPGRSKDGSQSILERTQPYYVSVLGEQVRPLSNDLRERVVAAVGGGDTYRSVAAGSGVAVSTVVKWSPRYGRQERWRRGRSAATVSGYWRRTGQQIDQIPHLTLHKLKDELAVRGIVVSHNAV